MRTSGGASRYGLLIDVGSGSIGFAIVESDQTKKRPKTIWQHREHVPIKQIESIADSSKLLLSALTDMALTLSSEGFSTLQAHTNSTKTTITEVQATVSAPWSYSISRTITFDQEEAFPVTDELIHDLAVAAGDEAMRTFGETNAATQHDVTETSRCVLDAYAAGYRLPAINKQMTSTLTLTHTTTLVYTTLHAALMELTDKLFAGVPLHVTSSMLSLYNATRQLKPHVYDVCLVDVTDEATEIGIVRDGSLTYCTHTAFGTHALAREIAATTDRPVTEVASRLGELLSTDQTKTTEAIVDAYREKVATLFKETGDALSIPRTVYLLADTAALAALEPIITVAASHASKTTSTLIPISKLLNTADGVYDHSLDTAARFFHTTHNLEHFEYL